MPTVTYLSDIHLEFYNRSLPYGIDLKGYPGEIKISVGMLGLNYNFTLTCGGSRIMMSRQIWYIFVFMAEKEERSTWLSTMGSIHDPFTSVCSYVINRQRDM